MATRTYTQKDGTIWEWEETPELLQQLQELYKQANERTETN